MIADKPDVKHGDLSAYIVIGAMLLCFFLVGIAHCQPTCSQLAQVTLSGKLAGANGLPAKNYVMTLKPSQQGYIAGCNVNLAINTTCATSTDGSVVGIQNPLTATVNTTSGAGSLGAGTYYTVYEWYDAAGNVTLASPETIKTLSASGSLVVNPPASGIPALAVGMDVFIGTTSGGETLQGQTTGSASFVQSAALISGATPASSNTTLCQVTANDTIWPTGTGYNVSLVDSVGNPIPQYPMQWQLLGPGTTINLSNGLPYYHGTVFYPIPILANPANHGTQSISGTLDLGGYFLRNVARVGVGTTTPAWGLDVEGAGADGLINAKGGYLLNGSGGTAGQCLASDGTAFDTQVACLTSIGSIFYQTVQAAGASKPQEPRLNLIAGTNATVSCVDNAGNTSTDCTIASTAASTGANPNIPTITCTGCTPFLGYNDGAGVVSTITSHNSFTLAFGGTYLHAMACVASTAADFGVITETNYAITSGVVSSNVATFAGSFTGLTAGTTLDLEGFPTSTFFNGQIVTVLSTGLSPTQFQANFTHADGGGAQAAFALPNNPYSVSVGINGSGGAGPYTIHYLCHQ